MTIHIDDILSALDSERYTAARFTPEPRHAAVAMVLHHADAGLEACFIRRAEREGDPWSGQVAFPGGRASAGDRDAPAVAERETHEEVGMVLHREQRVGALPYQSIARSNPTQNLTLSPFIYLVGPEQRASATPKLPAEVASVFWVPLPHLFDHRACTDLEYPAGSGARFPGIAFGEHVIWGLTLRVLGTFAELLRRPLPALD